MMSRPCQCQQIPESERHRAYRYSAVIEHPIINHAETYLKRSRGTPNPALSPCSRIAACKVQSRGGLSVSCTLPWSFVPPPSLIRIRSFIFTWADVCEGFDPLSSRPITSIRSIDLRTTRQNE